MKAIAQRVWSEPAVFIGLLTSIGLIVITVATGDKWDTATIAGVIAPLASALGIRGYVSPTHKEPHE
jgi:ascorbate-specific PTS system EIIC-type component UlaA